MVYRPSSTDLNQEEEFLSGGGGAGELIRSMDWSATSLGSRNSWPENLRTVVNLILANSFPMAILWGVTWSTSTMTPTGLSPPADIPMRWGSPSERCGRRTGNSIKPSLRE